MKIEVIVETARPRMLAAVRRTVELGAIGGSWRPALDQVWEFLRGQPGLRTDGSNIFLYHHAAHRGDPMDVDFGVEVTRSFIRVGNVFATETPAGEVARAVHVGSYARLGETHNAIHAWAAANHRAFGGKSWEVYGDWNVDPAKLETTVAYLLR
jgi:hypothetical protein